MALFILMVFKLSVSTATNFSPLLYKYIQNHSQRERVTWEIGIANFNNNAQILCLKCHVVLRQFYTRRGMHSKNIIYLCLNHSYITLACRYYAKKYLFMDFGLYTTKKM